MADKNTIVIISFVLVLFILFSAFGGNISGEAAAGVKGAPTFQCNDHKDNDKDGKCDFKWQKAYCSDGSIPGDPGCISKDDNDESTDCIPACNSNEECGTSGYIGDPYCGSDGNVYKDYLTYTCENAGKCSSVCNQQTTSYLWENCNSLSLTCSNGQCTNNTISIILTSYCGDNTCSSNEDYTNCPSDCLSTSNATTTSSNSAELRCLSTSDGICPSGCLTLDGHAYYTSDVDCCINDNQCYSYGTSTCLPRNSDGTCNYGTGSCTSETAYSNVADGCCPTTGSAGVDADCCTNAGYYWVKGAYGYYCSKTPEEDSTVQCSNTRDNICPTYCTAGTDADCCNNKGWYWLKTNWGYNCYSTNYNPGCYGGEACSFTSDGCCPNWCSAGSDINC